jgi:hypothetical protein
LSLTDPGSNIIDCAIEGFGASSGSTTPTD